MIKNRFFLTKKDYFLAIISAVFAYQINNYFGFIGINSADSFQTFDSGNRVLKGDLPFRDYWAASGGPIIDIMQSFFFKILGISWSTYVVHASILNAFFAISVYLYSRSNKISKNKSFLFAILSGILMYPAAGTPQVDHHTIIIGTISLILFFTFLKKKYFRLMVFLPLIFLLCFFIKQVPTTYYVATIVGISLIYAIFLKEYKVIIYLFFGSLFAFALLFLFLNLNNIFIADIYKQYISLTLDGASTRIDDRAKGLFVDNLFKIKYIILFLIPFIFLVIQNLYNKDLKNKENYFLDVYLFFCLIVSSCLHESYTDNQSVTFGLLPVYSILILSLTKENKSRALFYIFCALSLIIGLRLINENQIYIVLIAFLLLIYFFGKKFNISLKKTSSVIIIYTLLTSLLYFENIIRNRYWFDIVDPNWNNAIDAKEIDPKFSGLIWLSNEKNSPKEIFDIKDILSYLKSLNENYIIITNYQIYNSILDKKNYSPVKYWWNNFTYPSKENRYKNEFDNFFIKKININNVKKIIVAAEIKGVFKINEFEWLNKCAVKETQNKNFDIYNIINEC